MSENKYPIGGYAPGNYINRCCDCGQSFKGDKRAVQCETCAIYAKEKFDALSPAEQEEVLKRNAEMANEMFTSKGSPGEINYGHLWARHSKVVTREDLGKYRIDFEGLKKAVEEVMSLQPKPAGAVWVKGDYDRLYDQLKADVNCRIVCYVDYNTRSKNPDGSPYILRDICSIWGENMEFGSRGIGYGSVRFIPGDYKENFIELCKQMNVEWLDESGTASNIDVIDPDELWDEHSAYIDDNIDDLSFWAGKTVMTKDEFLKAFATIKK